MKKHVGEETAIRIDNRMSFPVDMRREPRDFFDFLRAAGKLACHGHMETTELEIDAGGCLHSYVAPESSQSAKPFGA